jgi:hypothetical protein
MLALVLLQGELLMYVCCAVLKRLSAAYEHICSNFTTQHCFTTTSSSPDAKQHDALVSACFSVVIVHATKRPPCCYVRLRDVGK